MKMNGRNVFLAGVLLASSPALADLDRNNADTFTLASLGQTPQVDSEFGYSVAASGAYLLIGAPRYVINGRKAGAVFQIRKTDSLLDPEKFFRINPKYNGNPIKTSMKSGEREKKVRSRIITFS